MSGRLFREICWKKRIRKL